MVFAMVAAGVPLGAAGLIFPAGYVTLNFLGLEMVTGSFATMPIGMYAGTVTPFQLVRNWTWTLTGNLLGGLFFGWLIWFSFTYGGSVAPNPMLTVITKVAEHKVEYVKYGELGWFAAIGMGVLCNWLVSLGSVMSKATRSTVGRLLLMWIPIAMFFALGFEHTVVNMWLIPSRYLLGRQREHLRLVGLESDPGHHRQYPGCGGVQRHPVVLHPYFAEIITAHVHRRSAISSEGFRSPAPTRFYRRGAGCAHTTRSGVETGERNRRHCMTIRGGPTSASDTNSIRRKDVAGKSICRG